MGVEDRERKDRIRHLKHFVYALTDPRTGHPKYVGLSHDVEKRYKSHFQRSYKTTRKWIDELRLLNLEPGLIVLCESKNGCVGLHDESDCIYALGLTYQLLNITGNVEFINRRSESIAEMREKRLTYRLFHRMRGMIRLSLKQYERQLQEAN